MDPRGRFFWTEVEMRRCLAETATVKRLWSTISHRHLRDTSECIRWSGSATFHCAGMCTAAKQVVLPLTGVGFKSLSVFYFFESILLMTPFPSLLLKAEKLVQFF